MKNFKPLNYFPSADTMFYYKIHTIYFEQPQQPPVQNLSESLTLPPSAFLSQVFSSQSNNVKSLLSQNKEDPHCACIYTPCTTEFLNKITLGEFFQINKQSGHVFNFYAYFHNQQPTTIFKNKLLNQFYTSYLLITNFDKPQTIEKMFVYLQRSKNFNLLLTLIEELIPLFVNFNNQQMIDRLLKMKNTLEKNIHLHTITIDLTTDEEQVQPTQDNEYLIELPDSHLPEETPSFSVEVENFSTRSLTSSSSSSSTPSSPFSPSPLSEALQETEPSTTNDRIEKLIKQNQKLQAKVKRLQKFLQKIGKEGLHIIPSESRYNFRQPHTTLKN